MSSVLGGHAALAICESMLLSLTENKIIDKAEAKRSSRTQRPRTATPSRLQEDRAAHEQAATVVDEILKGGNSVWRA